MLLSAQALSVDIERSSGRVIHPDSNNASRTDSPVRYLATPPKPVQAILSHNRFLATKVRRLCDYLQDHMAACGFRGNALRKAPKGELSRTP